MNLLWLLVVILLIFAVAGAPTWGYSRGWGLGWFPSGGVFLLVIILVILLATGRMGNL